MPELRSRPRRNRASNRNPNPKQNNNDDDDNNNPIGNPINEQFQEREQETARKLTDARPRRGRGRGRGRRPAAQGRNNAIGAAIRETRLLKREDEEEDRVLREGVGERGMDEYDSGGRSGDKGAAAEDEGSTAPLPEKI